MSSNAFLCCSECGEKLYATFFCRACSLPSCSLECYRRHQAKHARPRKPAQDRQQIGTSVELPESPR